MIPARGTWLAAALHQLSASDFAMPRYQIARDDSLLWRILDDCFCERLQPFDG